MWLARTNGSTTAATTVLALSRLLKSARVTLVLVHAAQTNDILTLEEKTSSAACFFEQKYNIISLAQFG